MNEIQSTNSQKRDTKKESNMILFELNWRVIALISWIYCEIKDSKEHFDFFNVFQ